MVFKWEDGRWWWLGAAATDGASWEIAFYEFGAKFKMWNPESSLEQRRSIVIIRPGFTLNNKASSALTSLPRRILISCINDESAKVRVVRAKYLREEHSRVASIDL